MAIYKSRLPNAYQEVEYIESSGTQYIDSNVIPDNSTGLKVKFSQTSSSDDIVVGCISQTNGRFWISVYNNAKQYISFNINSNPFDCNLNEIYNTENNFLNSRKGKINGIDVVNINETLKTTTNSIYVFGANYYQQGFNLGCSCKIYNLMISQGSNVIRNFIPCYRKSDNEIGLYDLVNNVFYTNQGTGTFTKGKDVLIKIASVYQGTTRMTKIYKGEQCVFNDLPKGYTKCEYIESSGTEYINSEIKGKDIIRYKMSFEYVSKSSSSANVLIGSSNPYNMPIMLWQDKLQYIVGNSGSFHEYYSNADINIKYDVNFEINSGNINAIINNQTFTSTYEGTAENNYNITIFAFRIGGAIFNYSSAKLYSCQIYDNSTLVRNFIPYLDTNGTPCLYDTVSKQPFYNQGSGTFKYKVKLPSGYQQVEYIESSGTQYINSGILCSSDLIIKVKFMNTSTNTVSDVFGNFVSENDSFRLFCYTTQFYLDYGSGNGTANRHFENNYPTVNVLQELEIGNGYVKNLTSQTNIITFSTTSFSKNYNLFITKSLANATSKNRIYYFELYDNGALVRNFIPCYRISDNVIGLYDMINKKFYTNAGTGTFLKGADV